MAKEIISVVYDRRKTFEKFGYGYAEILIYLGRKQHKYITLAKCTSDEVPNVVSSPATKEKMQKCRDVLPTMSVMEEEMSCAVFDIHYLGKKPKVRPNYYKGTDMTTNGAGLQRCQQYFTHVHYFNSQSYTTFLFLKIT